MSRPGFSGSVRWRQLLAEGAANVCTCRQVHRCERRANGRAPGPHRRVRQSAARSTRVSAEKMEGHEARIDQSDGAPPGGPSTGLQILYDGEQGTAVVLQ